MRTAALRPMFGELLSNRRGAARVGLERRDIGGRGIGRFAEQPPHDPGRRSTGDVNVPLAVTLSTLA